MSRGGLLLLLDACALHNRRAALDIFLTPADKVGAPAAARGERPTLAGARAHYKSDTTHCWGPTFSSRRAGCSTSTPRWAGAVQGRLTTVHPSLHGPSPWPPPLAPPTRPPPVCLTGPSQWVLEGNMPPSSRASDPAPRLACPLSTPLHCTAASPIEHVCSCSSSAATRWHSFAKAESMHASMRAGPCVIPCMVLYRAARTWACCAQRPLPTHTDGPTATNYVLVTLLFASHVTNSNSNALPHTRDHTMKSHGMTSHV